MIMKEGSQFIVQLPIHSSMQISLRKKTEIALRYNNLKRHYYSQKYALIKIVNK